MSVWITKLDDVDDHDARWRLAVKDNIDVAGLPTTAAHPDFAYLAARSATAVERLTDAGAVVVGKTNLDQFATGLTGTRSPYGACRNPHVEDRIAGGSSSGSAVVVATGAADIALGTDTAGSGRVPAALCGVVGVKPTRGLVSTAGVVPASPSLDCVSFFAPTVNEAACVADVAAGFDERDPRSRRAPSGTPVAGSAPLRVGVPRDIDVDALDPAARVAWTDALVRIDASAHVHEVDLTPYVDAGSLVYDAFVAERVVAFGEFLATHAANADPAVASILAAARDVPAPIVAERLGRLPALRAAVAAWWSDVDVVVVPTVAEAPTHAEVAADPIGVNARLGRFTTGANPLDLCAVAVPCGVRRDGVPFGVTFLAPAFADHLAAVAAARLNDEPDPSPPAWSRWTNVVVVGAHLRGQPLNADLVRAGGRFVSSVTTASHYRLFALDTVPPKPGLVRVAERGAAIEGELWVLPTDAFGAFVAAIPPPLGIGTIELADGRHHQGFLCEAAATAAATDVTEYRSWPAYLARG